jgi:hypothetical protein
LVLRFILIDDNFFKYLEFSSLLFYTCPQQPLKTKTKTGILKAPKDFSKKPRSATYNN